MSIIQHEIEPFVYRLKYIYIYIYNYIIQHVLVSTCLTLLCRSPFGLLIIIIIGIYTNDNNDSTNTASNNTN